MSDTSFNKLNDSESKVLPTLIITVHGTWAAGKNPEEPKWWESNSEFSDWLREEMSGVNLVFEEFMWSGANSDRDRSEASRTLATFLRKIDRTRYNKVHIIAHSHGGNVVELAVNELNQGNLASLFRSAPIDDLINNVITVGTPYFRTKVPLLTRLGQVGSLLTIPGAIFLAYGFIDYLINPPFGPGSPSEEVYFLGGGFLMITFILCLITAYPYTLEFVQTMKFGKNRKRLAPKWLALSHKSDEAIAALKTADTEKLNLFAPNAIRASLFQSIKSIGILAFAVSIVFGILWSGWAYYNTGIVSETIVFLLAPTAIVGVTLPVLLITLYLFLLFFAPFLSRWGNNLLNGRIHGFALGQDYLNSLDAVSDVPHTMKAERFVLEDTWHDDMLTQAQDALKAVITRNHISLFRRDLGTQLKDVLGRTDSDRLFESLVHTTYFSQRRLAKFIADQLH